MHLDVRAKTTKLVGKITDRILYRAEREISIKITINQFEVI